MENVMIIMLSSFPILVFYPVIRYLLCVLMANAPRLYPKPNICGPMAFLTPFRAALGTSLLFYGLLTTIMSLMSRLLS